VREGLAGLLGGEEKRLKRGIRLTRRARAKWLSTFEGRGGACILYIESFLPAGVLKVCHVDLLPVMLGD